MLLIKYYKLTIHSHKHLFSNFKSKTMQIATQAQIKQFQQKHYSNRKTKIWAFYNSELDKVIFDQKDMLLPVDDRISTRGHGTFDVVYVKKKHIINLDAHVDRLYSSSQTVDIFPILEKQKVKLVLKEVMKIVFDLFRKQNNDPDRQEKLMNQVFGIRLVMSSGYGDFGIASIDKKPVFYALVFEPYIKRDVQYNGVKDYVVKYVSGVNSDLVHTKTTNYLQNAMMANMSKKKGGYVGIKALESGVLLQASIANIAFIFGKQFAAPKMDSVIKGTTIIKLLKYIQMLKQQGKLDSISFRDIKIEEAQQASEMIILGGDKIVPVLSLNDITIGDGQKGYFTKLFQEWYAQINEQLTPVQ